MEYTIATNWDPNLLDEINYPEVKSIFGGLPNTPISSGRSSLVMRSIDKNKLKEYIISVHKKGWDFDYNINSSCTQNKELTAQGYKEIRQYFDWVCEFGIDSVTIAVPNLIHIIKKHYPQLKIKVSTFQKIHSVAMAKRFEDMGVDSIMLSEHIARDFKLLRAIRESVKCKLVLIANSGCIYGCPNMFTHANSIAHSGLKTDRLTVFTEIYGAGCLYKRLQHREEIIKMCWIRPEDVIYYEKIGIDRLKIIERTSTTESLGERMKAYNDRNYNGNLLNLLGQMFTQNKSEKLNLRAVLKGTNASEMKKSRRFIRTVFPISLPEFYHLDNKSIPQDFIQGFEKRDCSKLLCEKCGYCKEIADLTIQNMVNKEEILDALEKLSDVKNEILDGTLLY